MPLWKRGLSLATSRGEAASAENPHLGRVEVESAYPSVVQHAETAQPARSHWYWCLTF